jgi:general secretion pathway protein D
MRSVAGILLTSALAAGFALPLGVTQAQQPPAVRQTEQGIMLDFQDTELRLVLAALAEAGHLNLVSGELPARRITLRTNQPVRQQDILALLRSLTASNGLKAVDDGPFLRIEPAGRGAATPGAGAATADTAGAERRLFVYRLKHARAARLAGTLSTIFGGRGALAESGRLSEPSLSEGLRAQRVPPMGVEPKPQVNVEVAPTPTQPASLPGQLRGDVQIVPEEATNALLVRAQTLDWGVVKQAIESLDLRPLQVLIEVLIAEVRRTSDFELGVSAKIGSDTASGGTRVVGTLTGSNAGDVALHLMRLGRVDVDVTLSALASTGRVRILSRPVLLAQNNQEAKILIGSERPFIQVFRSLPTDAAVRDQVVQYRDVGTSLAILPTINDDGYVSLQVSQQVSTATSETQFGAPIISTREASTHLFVRDGQTVVIGGLVERERDQTKSGVPLLKDLPLIGRLFGSTSNITANSELFVFLTPHVIATDADADRVREGMQGGTDLLREQLPQPLPLIPATPPPAKTDSGGHAPVRPEP